MGEGKYGSEVWMFDDNGLGNESRLLIVAVDEDAQAAKIIWEYRLGSHAKIYGDCDPLPSGNVYGSYWRYNYGGDDESQSGIIEVTRDTQRTAWQLKIYGKACPRGGDRLCSVDYLVEGWMMYSVERFFETPLLPSADAGDDRRVFDRGGRDVLARDAKRVLAPRAAVGRDDGDGRVGRAR